MITIRRILLFFLILSLFIAVVYALTYAVNEIYNINLSWILKFPNSIYYTINLAFVKPAINGVSYLVSIEFKKIVANALYYLPNLSFIKIVPNSLAYAVSIVSSFGSAFLNSKTVLLSIAFVCDNCVSAVSQSATISLTGTGGNAVSLGINSLVGILLAFAIISLPALVLVGAGLGLAGLLFGLVLGVGLAYMGGLLPFWFIVLLGMLLLAILTLQFRREGTAQ